MDHFVGRGPELDTLRESLRRANNGSGSLALVSGEAGIGKTTLVQRLLSEAKEQEVLVLTGSAYDLSATPPYGQWSELARSYQPAGDLPGLPTFLGDGSTFTDLPSKDALFRATLAFVRRISEQLPLVLLLEDLHWSVQASLDLLRFVVRNIGGYRVLVIATYRDDEITRQHALFQLLPALIRESNVERIDLRALDEKAVRELVEQQFSLSRDDHDLLVRYLLAWAEGNPLFTVELLRTLELEGIVAQTDEGWRLRDLSKTSVPRLIQQMVERRMANLPAPAYSGLQIAAVLGHEVPLELWERLVGAAIVASGADHGLENGLVIESPAGNTVTFRHALFHETVYRSLTLIRRRQVHRQIAEVLVHQPSTDPDVVAYHLQQAGDPRAGEWLLLAGERAERGYAWLEAVDRYTAAIDIIQSNSETDQKVAGPVLRIGQLLRIWDPERGVVYLQRAHQAAIEEGDDALAMHTLFHIGQMECVRGNQRAGIRSMQTAVEGLIKAPRETEQMTRWALQLLPGSARRYPLEIVNGTLAVWLAAFGRYREAITAVERHLELDWKQARVADRFDLVLEQTKGHHDGFHGLGIALAGLGQVEESRLAFALAKEHFRRLDALPLLLLVSHSMLATLHFSYRTSDVEGRQSTSDTMRECWRRFDKDWHASDIWLWEYSLLQEGRWAELRELIEATPLSTSPQIIPRVLFRDFAVRVRARLAWYQGDVDVAWQLINDMFPQGPATEPGAHVCICATEVQRIAAGIALDSGQLDLTRTWLEAHDRWLEWSESIHGRADGMLLWAQLSVGEGDIGAAEGLAGQAREQASDPEQPMALIAIYRFLGELACRLSHHEAADEHLRHSLELATVCRLPFERTLTLLAQADLETARDNRVVARQLVTEARRICTELGAQSGLQRAEKLLSRLQTREVEPQFGLSVRELEVLRLLVRGMSDNQIAEELFISRHTVIRHVASIRRKLDVDSRAGAVAVAFRNELI